MRNHGLLLCLWMLWAVSGRSQGIETNAPAAAELPPAAESGGAGAENDWSFSVSVYTYVVPEEDNYAQPTIALDRDWFHAEARYNYEDLETGSVWIGYNLSFGDKLTLEVTPMLGGVFGQTTGIAPGYKGSLSWWRLELYSEGEYVLDTSDVAESFFYNWSELTLAPLDWFRFGLVTQRTRVYKSDRDVERGFLLGFSIKQWDLAAYVLNPDEDKPTFVAALGWSF